MTEEELVPVLVTRMIQPPVLVLKESVTNSRMPEVMRPPPVALLPAGQDTDASPFWLGGTVTAGPKVALLARAGGAEASPSSDAPPAEPPHSSAPATTSEIPAPAMPSFLGRFIVACLPEGLGGCVQG